MASTAPDLNPIEAVWNMSNKSIDKQKNDTYFYQKLERVVQEEWKKLDVRKILSCIDSIPSRCNNVIKNKGGYFGY